MIEKPISFMSSDGNTTYTINDRSSDKDTLNVSPYYYIEVRQVDGFTSADIRYESHPVPMKNYERSGDVFRSGKTLTLTGAIYARGVAEYRIAEDYLGQMFWDTAIRQLRFYRWNFSGQLYHLCRVSQDLAIVQSKDSWNPNSVCKGSWTVALRCDKPFVYKVSDDSQYYSWQS